MINVDEGTEIRRLHHAEQMSINATARSSALPAPPSAPPSARPPRRAMSALASPSLVDSFEPAICGLSIGGRRGSCRPTAGIVLVGGPASSAQPSFPSPCLGATR